MKSLRQFLRSPRQNLRKFNRGSVLVLTLFIVTSLSFAVASLIKLSITELQVNQRSILQLDANNAAEAASEYAMSSLKMRWDNQASFPANQFVNNPVTIPSDISSYLWTNTDVNATNITIKAGLVPYPQSIYIDPNDPANYFDPQRGKIVSACDVYVYTKAITTAKQGASNISATAYACQALEVRDAPLFSHAIFYNMDLEFHPGPNMTITGPVHANGNIWAVASTGLTFSGPITTSGSFNVGLMPWPTNWSNTSESSQTGNLVFIPNGSGGYATPFRGSGSQQASSSYWDSRTTNFSGSNYTNWRDLSANRWGGSLQTSANGVPDEKLTGFDDYVYHVNNTTTDLNYAYAIIEPNQFNPNTNNFHKGAGENDKFERKAGIIIKVHALGTVNITGNFSYTGTNSSANLTANATSITANINKNINTTIANWMTNSTGNFVLSSNTSVANGSMTLSNGSVVSITASGNLNRANVSANSTVFLLVTQVANPSNNNSSVSSLQANSTNSSVGNTTLMYVNGSGNTTITGANNTGSLNVTATTSSNTTNVTYTRTVGFAYVEVQSLQSTVDNSTGTRSFVYDTSKQITDSFGAVVYKGDVVPQAVAVNASQITGTYNSTTDTWTSGGIAQDMLRFRPGLANPGNSTDVWNGLYDGRRGSTISTVELDIGKFKSLVDDHVTGQGNNAASVFTNGTAQTYIPSDQYNGVLYVEFPQLPGNSTRLNSIASGNVTYAGDKVTDSIDNAGLVILNATSNSTSTGVPNPTYNDPSLSLHAGRQLGFTIATNNCIYVKGNYNADGNLSTPQADTTANQQYNSTMPDIANTPDPPCALVADSITCLSGNWSNRKSHSSSPVAATATEVNAAIVAGIAPSNPANSAVRSGGSHNFPRFLEDWGSIVFRYRGSLVNLYESELGNEPWSTSYYSPPNREWGFYNEFAKGNYPPGTPNARTYYRVGFQLLTKAQYTARTAGL